MGEMSLLGEDAVLSSLTQDLTHPGLMPLLLLFYTRVESKASPMQKGPLLHQGCLQNLREDSFMVRQ